MTPIRIHPTYMPKSWYYYGFWPKEFIDRLHIFAQSGTGFAQRRKTQYGETRYNVITLGFLEKTNKLTLKCEHFSSLISEVEEITWEQIPKKYKKRKLYTALLTDSDEFNRKMAKEILKFFK